MRDEWDRVSLGEVTEVGPREPPLPSDAPFVPMDAVKAGVRWPRYYEPRGSRGGARARALDVLFARITPCLENGKVAQVPDHVDRCGASTELVVIRPGPHIDPAFLYTLTTTEWFRRAAADLMTGTTGRQRVSPRDIASIEVDLPPLVEQRRIADLVVAIDEVIARAGDVSLRAERTLDIALDEWQPKDDNGALLDDVAVMGSGPSWKAENESRSRTDSNLRVLGIMNTPSGRMLDLTKEIYVDGLSSSVRRLSERSVLMIRTNGNRNRIGNVYRVLPEAYGWAFSAFQIGLDAKEPRNTDFIYWMLRRPSFQEEITEAASGTTGLGNIAVGWLKQQMLPWPKQNEREAAVRLFDSAELYCRLSWHEIATLADLRAAVLSDLLSRNHEIPESYDALFDTSS